MSRRSFSLSEGASNKFWAITLDGASHTVEFGRIGTTGQSSQKDFGSDAEAKASHDKLISEKMRKGYVEEGAGATGSTTTSKPSPPKPKAKAKDQAKSETPVEKPEEAPRSVAPPESIAEIEEMPRRSFDLGPGDWSFAPWRSSKPIPRPEPRPFDVEDAMARLEKVTTATHNHQWHWDWARMADNPSIEESKFWLVALSEFQYNLNAGEYLKRVRAKIQQGGKPPTISKWMDTFKHCARLEVPEIACAVFQYYDLDECLKVWAKPPGQDNYGLSLFKMTIFRGFLRHVRPYLTADEVQSMRESVRSHIDLTNSPPGQTEAYPTAWYLAATLDLGKEIVALVQSWPDDHFIGSYNYRAQCQYPQRLVLGQGNPERIVSEMKRLKLKLGSPGQVRAWLATTGFDALDLVRDSILGCSKREEADALTEALGLAKGPEVAPVMLDLMTSAKGPRHPREWLEANLAFAIAGLVEVAGGRGKLAEAAVRFLREQKKKGHGAFLEKCLANAPAEVADRVRREVLDYKEVDASPIDDADLPKAIQQGLAEASKLKPPSWIAAGDLPKILIGDRCMTDEQVSGLLAGLVKSTLTEPLPIVRAVREHADRATLDEFAWSLCERWLQDGAATKEKWAMLAVGQLGSDGSVLKLTPLIRAWPGENQHSRSVVGLECLRAIGTDGAMIRLNGIAQKVPFKGLRAKAAEMMEAIAADRKMTRAQLEDRIVPDCDLDERGTRVFDFGPRQFSFALGAEMKPMVRDPDGKLKADLPKPGAKDDARLAAEALEAWKLLKKEVREVAKVQAARLEQAMVSGRRWTPEDFESLLVQHPLLINLVRLVLWGGYDKAGKLVSTFRVTDERDHADAKDKPVKLDALASIGVVHPLDLEPADASTWGEVFGDYEIIPPFPQLGRPAYHLEPDDVKGDKIDARQSGRVPGSIHGASLLSILDRMGWDRGVSGDAGVVDYHVKRFEGADVSAILGYQPGVLFGQVAEADAQTIDDIFFVSGKYSYGWAGRKESIPPAKVDRVVISEVLATLAALASKSK